MAKSELHRDYILELESELQEFEKKADAATKRMQILVYPAMVAFVILAVFGFYLIYSLTSDVRRMADTFVNMSGSMDTNMDSIAGTMGHMSGKMDSLVNSTETMSTSTSNIVESMSGMRAATYDMAASTNNMQRDLWSMNKNISTPLSFMNSFLPWKDSQSMPFQGSSAPLPESHFVPRSYQVPPPAVMPMSNYNTVPTFQMPASTYMPVITSDDVVIN